MQHNHHHQKLNQNNVCNSNDNIYILKPFFPSNQHEQELCKTKHSFVHDLASNAKYTHKVYIIELHRIHDFTLNQTKPCQKWANYEHTNHTDMQCMPSVFMQKKMQEIFIYIFETHTFTRNEAKMNRVYLDRFTKHEIHMTNA